MWRSENLWNRHEGRIELVVRCRWRISLGKGRWVDVFTDLCLFVRYFCAWNLYTVRNSKREDRNRQRIMYEKNHCFRCDACALHVFAELRWNLCARKLKKDCKMSVGKRRLVKTAFLRWDIPVRATRVRLLVKKGSFQHMIYPERSSALMTQPILYGLFSKR